MWIAATCPETAQQAMLLSEVGMQRDGWRRKATAYSDLVRLFCNLTVRESRC